MTIKGMQFCVSPDGETEWLTINSGLGAILIGIAFNESRNDNPILAFQPSDCINAPGTPFPVPEDGSPILDQSICIEFHNEAAVDQVIDFLQTIKRTYHKDV